MSQDLLHFSEHPVAGVGVEKAKVVGPGKLNQSRARDAGGQFAPTFHAH